MLRPDRPVKKADQAPIFEAGGQLANAYLGFVQHRFGQLNGSERDHREHYVPVLITNARLFFLDTSDLKIDFESADVVESPKDLSEVKGVVLKQPAASPQGFPDFRTSVGTDERNQKFLESIYVVNVRYLVDFFSAESRQQLAAT